MNFNVLFRKDSLLKYYFLNNHVYPDHEKIWNYISFVNLISLYL